MPATRHIFSTLFILCAEINFIQFTWEFYLLLKSALFFFSSCFPSFPILFAIDMKSVRMNLILSVFKQKMWLSSKAKLSPPFFNDVEFSLWYSWWKLIYSADSYFCAGNWKSRKPSKDGFLLIPKLTSQFARNSLLDSS